MKASHIFLFGVVFAFGYNIIRGLLDGSESNMDWSYTFAEVFAITTFIIVWYSIDAKLNKTYEVRKWTI